MITKEELQKLDKVFIKHIEGTYPDWCEDGGMDHLDGLYTTVENLDITSEHSIGIDGWEVGYDCFFTEDPSDLRQRGVDLADKAIEEGVRATECKVKCKTPTEFELEGLRLRDEADKKANTTWSAEHYNFNYDLTEKDIEKGSIKLDPYFVAQQWGIGSKDDSGCLFHSFKLFARWADKNSVEREIKALHAQTVRMAELYGVEL